MIRNQEKFDQAVQLRKRGFTLTEIAKYCDISKSTASKWLKNQPFSAAVTEQNRRRLAADNAKRLRLVAKARSVERKRHYADAERTAKTEFQHYQANPAFVAGLTMYLTAGDVADLHTIRFSHANPALHRTIISFCEQFLGVSRESVHVWLHLYQGADEEKAMKHWSRLTRVPYAQFYKNHYVKTKQKTPLHFGAGNTIIASTYHKQKLLTWLRLAEKTW